MISFATLFMRFQSTRPRGARLTGVNNTNIITMISIHAPAWGATVAALGLRALSRISIHAPAWGATVAALDDEIAVVISIPAPAWGATA